VSQPNQFAAQILESTASAYGGFAASLLVERHPEVSEGFAPWKANLTHRVLELSAALSVEEPQLFVSRVLWAAKALRARESSVEDLHSSLVCLREVLSKELPEAAGKEAGEYIDRAILALRESPPTEAAGLDPEDPQGRLALLYLQAVLEGDSRHAIDLIIAAVDEGLDPRKAYLEVLLPAQREVGGMWHVGDLGIAEEHFVTATSERVMSILAQRAGRRPANGKTVVAAAVAGNTHGLAVRVLADFFEMAGWRAVCLGADVPPSDLAVAAQYFDADLLLLSAALTTQIKAVRRSIEAVHKLENHGVKILVGGGAFAEAPELWRQLGADGHASTVEEAVDHGARLVGLG
jgi:methanogenic corrinoid protein MtbC1